MRRDESQRIISEPCEGGEFFKSVPRDCKIIIFSYLDFRAITSLPFVCKEWSDIVKNSSSMLFKLLCYHLWEVRVPEERASNWKQAYIDISKTKGKNDLIFSND